MAARRYDQPSSEIWASDKATANEMAYNDTTGESVNVMGRLQLRLYLDSTAIRRAFDCPSKVIKVNVT